jgi:hypothetical protein
LVFGTILLVSGCIFPDEDVSIDIEGAETMNSNITKMDGMRIRINNEVDRDFDNMLVRVIVPENINFEGNPGGKPLNLTQDGLLWVYSFVVDLKVGGTGVYSFGYTPEVYERQFDESNEYAFDFDVEVYDGDGNSIGNQTTTWRVVRV